MTQDCANWLIIFYFFLFIYFLSWQPLWGINFMQLWRHLEGKHLLHKLQMLQHSMNTYLVLFYWFVKGQQINI